MLNYCGVSKEKTLQVLLVDDDAVDRELFMDAIGFAGKRYVVSEAADGEAALEWLQ